MMLTILKQLIVVREAFAQGGFPGGGSTGGNVPGGGSTGWEFPGGGSTGGSTGGGLPNPLQYDTIEEVLRAVWGYLFAISIPLVAIMVIIGAFQIMFAAGNVERLETGKKTVLYAVIGFAIVLLAGGIVSVVGELLGVNCDPTIYGPPPPGC